MLLNITLLTVVQQLTLGMSCSWECLHATKVTSTGTSKISNSRTRGKYLNGGEIWSVMAACGCHVRVANMEHNWWVSNSREKKRNQSGFLNSQDWGEQGKGRRRVEVKDLSSL